MKKYGAPAKWIAEHLNHAGDECLVWPFALDPSGYAKFSFKGKKVWVHRYICIKVHGEPPTPKHEARHSCGHGDKGCVNPNHLSWGTRKQNAEDRKLHGTHARGSAVNGARLKDEDIIVIRSLKGKKLQREIAAEFGITRQMVGLIHKDQRWQWL